MEAAQKIKNKYEPGQLYITTVSWDVIHMMKNPHGIWVPKYGEPRYLIYPSTTDKYTIPRETPVMYVGTDGRPHVGVFLVEDKFLEIPYSILGKIVS